MSPYRRNPGRLHASVSRVLQWTTDAYTLLLRACSNALGLARGPLRPPAGSFQIGAGGRSRWVAAVQPRLRRSGGYRPFAAYRPSAARCSTPSAMSIIANNVHRPRRRAKAIGMWGSVAGLSLASGPVLGGLLVRRDRVRSIFWIKRARRPDRDPRSPTVRARVSGEQPRRLDLRSAAGQSPCWRLPDAGDSSKGQRSGWGSAPDHALFAVAVLAAIALVLARVPAA